MPSVSVIVAVYQAEKNIGRCCRSLFGQSLDDMEYIFVSDGSTDRSVEKIKQVLEDFPTRKAQTKIIDRRENRGVAYTRQEGFDNATGRYVVHCDSDDWVDLTMYERMYAVAQAEDADVVCCGYEMVGKSGRIFVETFNRADYFDFVVFNISPLTGSLCLKIVRRERLLAAGIRFPENIGWGEDFCVSVSGLLLSRKTVCMKEIFYHYWLNEDSITHTLTEKKITELIGIGRYMEAFLKKTGNDEKYGFQLNYLKFQIKLPLLAQKKFRDIPRWKSIYPECHPDVWKYDSPLSLKLMAWLISRNLDWLAYLGLTLRDGAKILLGKSK